MESNSHEGGSSSFWRTTSSRVPGNSRPSPKKDMKSNFKSVRGQGGSTSFHDFQESVSDAWDLGDDEFCIISGNLGKRISFIHYFIIVVQYLCLFNHYESSFKNPSRDYFTLIVFFFLQIRKFPKEFHIRQH